MWWLRKLFRRKPFRLLCPYCGSPFFWVNAGLVRYRNKLPVITSMASVLTCAQCGLATPYDDFVGMHRRWL